MGRPRRTSLGGYLYHVLNRGNGRLPVFHKDFDYEAFLHVVAETQEHVHGARLLAYCLMPNHWHLVLWPRRDGESFHLTRRAPHTVVGLGAPARTGALLAPPATARGWRRPGDGNEPPGRGTTP